MNKLRFHVPGIPLTARPHDTFGGMKRVAELGLDGMEMEWVHQVPLDKKKALEIKKLAEGLKVSLTVHGSYYINLATDDKAKRDASISRILKAAEIGYTCGARKLTFHAGFYQQQDAKMVATIIKDALEEIKGTLDDKNIGISISPETTGKGTQFGNLEELVSIAKELKIGLCIDFSHLHARTGGGYNSLKEYSGIIDFVEKNLGKEFLSDMYFHISGILYSQKGEKRHVCFLEKFKNYKKEGIEISNFPAEELREVDFTEGGPDIRWREILEVLKERNVGGVVVVEGPSLELDTLLLNRYYQSL